MTRGERGPSCPTMPRGPAGLDSSGETAAARVLSPLAERQAPRNPAAASSGAAAHRPLFPHTPSSARHCPPHLRKSKRPVGREMSPNRRRFSPAAATNTDKMASAPSPCTTSSGGSSATYAKQARMRHGASCPPTDPAGGARGSVTSGTSGLDHPHCGCAALEAPLGRGSFCS